MGVTAANILPSGCHLTSVDFMSASLSTVPMMPSTFRINSGSSAVMEYT